MDNMMQMDILQAPTEKDLRYAKMAQYFRSAKPDKDGIATIVFKKKLLKMFWLHFKKILA